MHSFPFPHTQRIANLIMLARGIPGNSDHSYDRLPSEMWRIILAQLEPHDLIRVREVSTTIHEIATDTLGTLSEISPKASLEVLRLSYDYLSPDELLQFVSNCCAEGDHLAQLPRHLLARLLKGVKGK